MEEECKYFNYPEKDYFIEPFHIGAGSQPELGQYVACAYCLNQILPFPMDTPSIVASATGFGQPNRSVSTIVFGKLLRIWNKMCDGMLPVSPNDYTEFVTTGKYPIRVTPDNNVHYVVGLIIRGCKADNPQDDDHWKYIPHWLHRSLLEQTNSEFWENGFGMKPMDPRFVRIWHHFYPGTWLPTHLPAAFTLGWLRAIVMYMAQLKFQAETDYIEENSATELECSMRLIDALQRIIVICLGFEHEMDELITPAEGYRVNEECEDTKGLERYVQTIIDLYSSDGTMGTVPEDRSTEFILVLGKRLNDFLGSEYTVPKGEKRKHT
jgi:hypothetical protein